MSLQFILKEPKVKIKEKNITRRGTERPREGILQKVMAHKVELICKPTFIKQYLVT